MIPDPTDLDIQRAKKAHDEVWVGSRWESVHQKTQNAFIRAAQLGRLNDGGATNVEIADKLYSELLLWNGQIIRRETRELVIFAIREALRLRDTGWTPKPEVDPDLLEARKIAAGVFGQEKNPVLAAAVREGKVDMGSYVQCALAALKRSRELVVRERAEVPTIEQRYRDLGVRPVADDDGSKAAPDDAATSAQPTFEPGDIVQCISTSSGLTLHQFYAFEVGARAENFRLIARITDGWHLHDGGPCPVKAEAVVEAFFRDGSFRTIEARYWTWSYESRRGDIIAYRLLPAEGEGA